MLIVIAKKSWVQNAKKTKSFQEQKKKIKDRKEV
jgi:hypothetical protein